MFSCIDALREIPVGPKSASSFLAEERRPDLEVAVSNLQQKSAGETQTRLGN